MEILKRLDTTMIRFAKKHCVMFARIALFIVYFWFGALKLFNLSPANPLVGDLLKRTLPFLTFDQFIIILAIFEVIIGILFLIPKLERLVAVLLVIHMVTTIMPLILLPAVTWQGFLAPTLEGQYIIKNVLIISAALVVLSSLNYFEQKQQA